MSYEHIDLVACPQCEQVIASVGSTRHPLASSGHREDCQLTGGDCAIIWCAACERWRPWAHDTSDASDRRAASSLAHHLNSVLAVADPARARAPVT